MFVEIVGLSEQLAEPRQFTDGDVLAWLKAKHCAKIVSPGMSVSLHEFADLAIFVIIIGFSEGGIIARIFVWRWQSPVVLQIRMGLSTPIEYHTSRNHSLQPSKRYQPLFHTAMSGH